MRTMKCGDLGTFDYRLPNIPETMILLGEMGFTSKKINSDNFEENELAYTAKMIMGIGKFVSNIDITIDGEKINTYKELLEHFVMMKYLTEVAQQIFSSINGGGKKKTSPKKQ